MIKVETQKPVDECTICLQGLENKTTSLKCTHVYHTHCIGEWLENHTTCPICRAEVDTTGIRMSLLKIRAYHAAQALFSFLRFLPITSPVFNVAMRLNSLAFSAAICKQDNNRMNQAKVGIVALGLIGALTNRTPLYVASLACDVAWQTFELYSAMKRGDTARALTHLTITLIDTCLIGAITLASPKLIIAAGMINILFLLYVGLREEKRDNKTRFEIGILTATAAVAFITESNSNILLSVKSEHFTLTNDHNYTISFEDGPANSFFHHPQIHVQPGEIVDFNHYNQHHVVSLWDKDIQPDRIEYWDAEIYDTYGMGGTSNAVLIHESRAQGENQEAPVSTAAIN